MNSIKLSKMAIIRYFKERFILLILLFVFTFAQETTPSPPKMQFPDVFQVEVAGIFQDEMVEVDGALYYDKTNNRAVLMYTYQNDTTTSIYNFNDNQLTYIQGVQCSVSDITDESGSFFQYNVDKETKKKTLGTPEQIFFFTESVFDRQELFIFPSYIYTATVDIPQYYLKKCEITHIFSKPEVEMSDCDGHTCRPTLVSITVRCPPRSDEDTEIFHIYNFFRFRSVIQDESVFQPPIGVHCGVASHKEFPEFPPYFSFSYDLVDEQKDTSGTSGVFTVHKKLWYDVKLSLVRIDEFDEGLLSSSRIFDFFGGTAYTIVATVPECVAGDLDESISLDEMTRLPQILFAKDPKDRKEAVYIGKRAVHGLDYDVWTQSYIDNETEAKVVKEIYFTNNLHIGPVSQTGNLTISHADIYMYEKNDDTGNYGLSLLTYLSINNFRYDPKEWEAFDISPCFRGKQKKGFSLKIEGPPIIEDSLIHEKLLEKLYMKLIILTKVSVVRISQLKGIFDGIYITEFTGWILDKIQSEGSKAVNKEPDTETTYNLIEKAAADGKLTITVQNDGKDQVYKITAVDERKNNDSAKNCFSGGTLAAVGMVLLLMGLTFGVVGFYLFFKKRNQQSIDRVLLHPMGD